MNIYNDKLILKTEYLRENGMIKAVVRTAERTNAICSLCGEEYNELRNACEPFDFRAHVFLLPEAALEKEGGFVIRLICRVAESEYFSSGKGGRRDEKIVFSPSLIISREDAINRTDRKLTLCGISGGGSAEKERWAVEMYNTKDGLPVRVYCLTTAPGRCGFIAGTPYGELSFAENKVQTVMEEAENAAAAGYEVTAAVNADFYDMFGDCKPSGLCVSRGTVIANPESDRAFFGITKDGTPVIGTVNDYPPDTLSEAVGGMQILVRNRIITDTAPLEPFGDTPHPRTTVGLRKDGSVLLMVVDGRRPSWSNGASLTELALLLINHGAETAINLDGGGSSTFIVRTPEGLTMLNHPADLARPTEDLIRPVFNSVIVVRKQSTKGHGLDTSLTRQSHFRLPSLTFL